MPYIKKGTYMPSSSSEMENMLSDDYKEMYKEYNLPDRNFDFPYKYIK